MRDSKQYVLSNNETQDIKIEKPFNSSLRPFSICPEPVRVNYQPTYETAKVPIAAIVSVRNEIKKIKDKKYAKYAKGQPNQFIITYILCCVAWFAIGFRIGFFSA